MGYVEDLTALDILAFASDTRNEKGVHRVLDPDNLNVLDGSAIRYTLSGFDGHEKGA